MPEDQLSILQVLPVPHICLGSRCCLAGLLRIHAGPRMDSHFGVGMATPCWPQGSSTPQLLGWDCCPPPSLTVAGELRCLPSALPWLSLSLPLSLPLEQG
ncbi:hypothetical protein H1C71_020008 [Ictidomys tridecemlineatus]|nr:hypothetical protein H1C71_020008 [Ictidomys tridecemlineatus]